MIQTELFTDKKCKCGEAVLVTGLHVCLCGRVYLSGVDECVGWLNPEGVSDDDS